jgi:hypothetical protein
MREFFQEKFGEPQLPPGKAPVLTEKLIRAGVSGGIG